MPKTVTRQRRDCDLKPGPTALESSTLNTRLPSHPGSHKPQLFTTLGFCANNSYNNHVFVCYYTPITEDGECMTEFRTKLNRGQAIGASLRKILKSHSIPISTKIRLMKAVVWPVATNGCECWTLRKNEETRFHAFEMKELKRFCGFRGQQRKH